MRRNGHLLFTPMLCLTMPLLLPASPAAADPASMSMKPVMHLDAAGNPVGDPAGFSRLTREDAGLSYELTAERLTPLNVYTVWWVLFKPDNTTMMLSTYGGGAVALPNGTASFTGRLPVGPLPEVDGRVTMVSETGAPFDNPHKVRVLLVLRDHGPIILAELAEMLSTFDGGCPPNTCRNALISNHMP